MFAHGIGKLGNNGRIKDFGVSIDIVLPAFFILEPGELGKQLFQRTTSILLCVHRKPLFSRICRRRFKQRIRMKPMDPAARLSSFATCSYGNDGS